MPPRGAFLTIRSLLHEAVVPADEIAPSTPLAHFTRRFSAVFLGPVARLCRKRRHRSGFAHRSYDAAIWGVLVAVLCLLVGSASGMYLLTIFGAVLFVPAYALSEYASRCLLPANVEFGKLQTFRDLAIVVAEASPAEPDAAVDGEAKFAD